MPRGKKNRKTNTLDRYIIVCIAFLILYTIAHTIIFAFTGNEAKVLDGLVFMAFSGEVVQCFFIKRFKLKEEAEILFGKKKKDDFMEDEGE